MSKRKEFSILKWIVFPSLSLALAAVIVWFNVRAFGWEDGAIYIGVVVAITMFSIMIAKYVRPPEYDDESDRLAIAAFVFEIILTLALVVNAAYSLSVQRSMSVARQAEARQSQNLDSVSKLKSGAAQREATHMLHEQSKDSKNSQVIFATNEGPLFWIMVCELVAYGLAYFTLLAVSSFAGRRRKSAYLPQNAPEGEFPEELDVGYAPRRKNAPELHLSQKARPVATPVALDRKGAAKALREHLGVIASYYPGRWFKVDLRDAGGVWIRMAERQEGREVDIAKTLQSDKLLAAVNRPDFRERLIQELIDCGFPIGEGR